MGTYLFGNSEISSYEVWMNIRLIGVWEARLILLRNQDISRQFDPWHPQA